MVFAHPELVEGCPFKPPMVRQAHHERDAKDFAIVLAGQQDLLTLLSKLITMISDLCFNGDSLREAEVEIVGRSCALSHIGMAPTGLA